MIGTSIKHWISYLLIGISFKLGTVRAELSEACIASAEALLSTNPELQYFAPQGTCEIDVTQTRSCTFDFSTISSNFAKLCTNAGGNFYEEDVKWNCKVNADGTTYKLTYNYLNYAACLGGNCTDAEAMESFEEYVFPAFEASLASQGFICDVSGENDVSTESDVAAESASVRGIVNVVVVILSASTMVFSFL